MYPSLTVLLNDEHLVTVAAHGLNIMQVSVFGNCVSHEIGHCDVSGGLYNEGPENVSLSWLPLPELLAEDELTVRFLEAEACSNPGRTLEELYPEGLCSDTPWVPFEQTVDNLAQMPRLREGFDFEITMPTGESLKATTKAGDHSYSFSVTWDWTRPAQARVSLRSNSLKSLSERSGGHSHARVKLSFGDEVRLRVESAK
ncbi:hypothetical protein O4G98_06005 [Zoogloeaceae bacterium G21618-S1]|nr:hypothetical protein [Zoogloeaceae bacterium G21618-S1]